MPRELEIRIIPGGLGSLNRSRSPAQVKDADIIDMEALTYEHDTWQKDGGAEKINDTALTGTPTISGLYDFVSGTFVKELIAYTDAGDLVTVNASGVDKTLKTGMGTNRFPIFVEGAVGTTKKLYIVNGQAKVQAYTGGTSTADITNPPADWTGGKPTWLFLHNGRMWGGGNTNDPHRIYGSALVDHDDYTSGNSVTYSVYPGEAERIVGGVSWRGRAYFFKYPQGIYYLDDSSSDVNLWDIRRTSRYVGLSGPGGIVEALDDVLFLSPDGYIHALSAVFEFGDAKSSAILPNALGTFIRENVNSSRYDRVQSIFYPTKRKVMFAVSGLGSNVNNLIVGLDIHRLSDPQGFKTTRDECEALAILRGSSDGLAKPIVGDSAGFVRKLDIAARDKDGSGYNAYWETWDIELFEQGFRRGNLKELEVEFTPVGNWNLSIEVFRDGVSSETLTFNMQGAGAILGSFTLGTDILGTEVLRNTRSKMSGDCRRIRLKGSNNTLNESFSVASQLIKYTPGNDR